MKITSIKTHKITSTDKDIFAIIDHYIKRLKEGSIVVIASKIIAITEGRIVQLSKIEKETLIKKEADLYLPKEKHKHNLFITIKDNYLTYSSGIDESNTNGYSVLWPKNPQESANKIRKHLMSRSDLDKVGVIITDMLAIPLKWGVIGGAIAYSGFKPLKDLKGTNDIFGRKYEYTQVGHLHGLAAAAAVVMGEGAEQTPLGIIEDISFVEFVDKNPTQKELDSLKISFEEDLYGPLLKAVHWKKGGSSNDKRS